MKTIYLPKLQSIKIENYSLYSQQPSFEFEFLDGISSIIGGNGIGKTTFVEILIYCLVGPKRIYSVEGTKKQKTKERIETPNFFKVRMNDKYEGNTLARATLTFIIDNVTISITRSLYENRVIAFSVDGILHDPPDDEEAYNNILVNLTRLSSIKSLDTIVRRFLFFDELRRNIAWDPDSQDEILRILFFEEQFDAQFKVLESLVTKLDTEARHLSEDRRVLSESIADMEREKDKLFSGIDNGPTQQQTLSDTIIKKNRLEQERFDLLSQLEETNERLRIFQESYDSVYGIRSSILAKLDRIESEIVTIEAELFKDIYGGLADFYLPLERAMINNGKCLACGATNKELRGRATRNRDRGQCLICSAPLIPLSKVYDQASSIEALNDLYRKKQDLINISNNKMSDLKDIDSKLSSLHALLKDLERDLDIKSKDILYIDSVIAKYSQDKVDTYTEILKTKQKEIEMHTAKISSKYHERDMARNELLTLHESFRLIVENLNNSLSVFFNKYASTFIGLKCELTVLSRPIKNIPHVAYIPKIDGSLREDIWSVSESQRFFLDQAFRMAIIDYLQHSIHGFNTFFITETPEGSLDISYEGKVAEMFILFAHSSNNIIFTSNLNSSRFLVSLYSKLSIQERVRRSLNLLAKGSLTKVQANNEDLRRVFSSIFGSNKFA